MSAQQGVTQAQAEGSTQQRLHDRTWKRFLKGPDPELLDQLYIPMLSAAVRYDRCCSYFSSSVLSAAASGFAGLIRNLEALGDRAKRPSIRLFVNEELQRDDVRVLMETGDLTKLEETLHRRFKTPKDRLEKERLGMLAWLFQKGYLDIKVGVMRSGEGIVHGKFGIAYDRSDESIVFSGSGNESASGLRANYERLEISGSWADPERHTEYATEFDLLWDKENGHPHVATFPLPEAVRLNLIKFAPKETPIVEPSTAIARQRASMLWRFALEAPYFPDGGPVCNSTAMVSLWPHQRRVVEETAAAWPSGRLLCDEVGMGKTVEAILVLRRLLAGRGVRRVLILLPAGLLKQWQAELREKGGMIFPRLESTNLLVWPDGKERRIEGVAEALQENVLLLSREMARAEGHVAELLNAEPWDLVLLDEAHAARRKKQEEGEYNGGTLLLDLLRRLQLSRRARGILLLSATPMQTHPWEPWDLLAVLGEGGSWLADFQAVRCFYRSIAAVRNGLCDPETAQRAAALVASDPEFPKWPFESYGAPTQAEITQQLAFGASTERKDVADWLRFGSPLSRRMHRNTRNTLRHYYSMGLLAAAPPVRKVEDFVFDYQNAAERAVYNSVKRYIEKRFTELEKEKPGKGFVMTIYGRRASSSPAALERSLERRRDGLMRIIQRKSADLALTSQDFPERLDAYDLPEGEGKEPVSSALPQDPKIAAAELDEVNSVIGELRSLSGTDTKRDEFFDQLRRITDDGRPVLVFTEYTDTMLYLRDMLVGHYGAALGCYNGDGGQLREGDQWAQVSKATITQALREGKLLALLCTDAASEGLNLQAAGAVINYDLPWNPSKVEQRIGRIDRIGQKYPDVRVINLFLKKSVDEQVYSALRRRCGLFEHFVGEMQPVLERARRMLLGHEPADAAALEHEAEGVRADPLAGETYLESIAAPEPDRPAGLSRADMPRLLEALTEALGFQVKRRKNTGLYSVRGPDLPRRTFSCVLEELERDSSVLPLSPFEPLIREAMDKLARPGERLPLVIGTCTRGAFRCSVAYWVEAGTTQTISSVGDLMKRAAGWSGRPPDASESSSAEKKAYKEAEAVVLDMEERASQRERDGLKQQLEAARLRLRRELGRYLMSVGPVAPDLNGAFHHQMTRDIISAQRLKQCYDKLGGYPEWPPDLREELEAFAAGLSENQRKARLLGTELDAALQDPRWQAWTSDVVHA